MTSLLSDVCWESVTRLLAAPLVGNTVNFSHGNDELSYTVNVAGGTTRVPIKPYIVMDTSKSMVLLGPVASVHAIDAVTVPGDIGVGNCTDNVAVVVSVANVVHVTDGVRPNGYVNGSPAATVVTDDNVAPNGAVPLQ